MRYGIYQVVPELGAELVGQLQWEGDGGWEFQTGSMELAERLRQIGAEHGVWQRVAYADDEVIADGLRFVKATDPGFIEALQEDLVSAGVVELRGQA